MSDATRSLFSCAEHALLEMRDRFNLARGDSISLDALEDNLNSTSFECEELLELLTDLAMEGKIVGLGDAVAEVNDQTGVLGRVRAVLGNDFLEGKASL